MSERNMKPLRPCRHGGCNRLTRNGYCDEHLALHRRDDTHSMTAAQRGYGSKWQRARASYLSEHPWCVECLKQGRHTLATDVDHIVPHKGNQKLFWDESNWQSLCHECHSRKTVLEDGGFGRPPGSSK